MGFYTDNTQHLEITLDSLGRISFGGKRIYRFDTEYSFKDGGVFDFSDVNVRGCNFSRIIDIVKYTNCPKHLIFNFKKITPSENKSTHINLFNQIYRAMTDEKSKIRDHALKYTHLWASKNIGYALFVSFCHALAKENKMEQISLNFSNNRIGCDAILALDFLLKSAHRPPKIEIDLSANLITDYDALLLAKTLWEVGNLKGVTLNIGSNLIGNEGLSSLIIACQKISQNRPLEQFELVLAAQRVPNPTLLKSVKSIIAPLPISMNIEASQSIFEDESEEYEREQYVSEFSDEYTEEEASQTEPQTESEDENEVDEQEDEWNNDLGQYAVELIDVSNRRVTAIDFLIGVKKKLRSFLEYKGFCYTSCYKQIGALHEKVDLLLDHDSLLEEHADKIHEVFKQLDNLFRTHLKDLTRYQFALNSLDTIKTRIMQVSDDPLVRGGIAIKYMDDLPSLPQIIHSTMGNVASNKKRIEEFSLVRHMNKGLRVSDLTPIPLNNSTSSYSYYSQTLKALPISQRCIFLMAGRGLNASYPARQQENQRVILVITEEELDSIFLQDFDVLLLESHKELKDVAKKNITVLINDSKKIVQFDGEGKKIDIDFNYNESDHEELFTVFKNKNATKKQDLFSIADQLSEGQWAKLDFIVKTDSQSIPIRNITLSDYTDLLVIHRLASWALGVYENVGAINSRRIAALEVSLLLECDQVMMMDDNINCLTSYSGELNNLEDIWNYWGKEYKTTRLLTTVVTEKPIHQVTKNKNQLGSKLFLFDSTLLVKVFAHIKIEELAFTLFLPSFADSLVAEDYYFQLMAYQAVNDYNQQPDCVKIEGTGYFNYSHLMLERLRVNKHKARNSLIKAETWLYINEQPWMDLCNSAVAYPEKFILHQKHIKGVLDGMKRLIEANLDAYEAGENSIKQLDIQSHHAKLNTSSTSIPVLSNATPIKISLKQLYQQLKEGFYIEDKKARKRQFELYEHQDKVILELIEHIEHYKFTESVLHAYSLATGTGKTRIQAIVLYLALCHLQFNSITEQSLVVVTTTKDLVTQTHKNICDVFSLCNRVSGQSIDPSLIIKVMSEGNAINQKIVQLNTEFKKKNYIFIYCEASFRRQVSESPESFHHIDLVFVDEYHKYINPITSCIYQLNGYDIQITNSYESTGTYYNTYLFNTHTPSIYFYNQHGEVTQIPFTLDRIFNPDEIRVMKWEVDQRVRSEVNMSLKSNKMITQKFHDFLTKANEIPQVASTPSTIPVYLTSKMATRQIAFCDKVPIKAELVPTTYFCINPPAIYQNNLYGLIEPMVSEDALRQWSYFNDLDQCLDLNLESFRDNLFKNEQLKNQLNELIIQCGGYPLFDQELITPCFILNNHPHQLIYRDENGMDIDVCRGYYVRQLLKQLKQPGDINSFKLLSDIDIQPIGVETNRLIKKSFPIHPPVQNARLIPFFGFSATPPESTLFEMRYIFSREEAVEKHIISPSIIRTMKYTKSDSLDSIFSHLLSFIHPSSGNPLSEMKGLVQFSNKKQVDEAAKYLRERYPLLPVHSIYSDPKKSNKHTLKLDEFKKSSAKGIILVVGMLSLGWDEPTLMWCASFKESMESSTWEQFLGRVVRWMPGKIGLALLRSDAKIIKRGDFAIKNILSVTPHEHYMHQKENVLIVKDKLGQHVTTSSIRFFKPSEQPNKRQKVASSSVESQQNNNAYASNLS